MREILFRGKTDKGEWVQGVPFFEEDRCYIVEELFICDEYDCTGAVNSYVHPDTVGQYTGLTDKNGTKIFEGDIVQYQNLMEFDIQSVVKFGKYKQDGSGGEYGGTDCLGFYVVADNFTCPDWCENEPEQFQDHWITDNLLQVNKNCKVIGNIHDNPDILIGGEK